MMTDITIPDLFAEQNLVHTKTDILAMSCAMYRLRDNNMFYSLTQAVDNIEHHITSVDIDMAKQIRDYYAGKWLLKMMTQQTPMTKFRKDLMLFITGYNSTFTYPKSYMGMIHQLPYFYHYDIELDELYSKCNTKISGISSYNTTVNLRRISGSPSSNTTTLKPYREIIYDQVLNLSFIKALDPKKKNKNVYEFVFIDQYGYMFMLEIDKNNSFLTYFQQYVIEHRVIKFTGQFRLKNRDGNEFYHSNHWEFIGRC